MQMAEKTKDCNNADNIFYASASCALCINKCKALFMTFGTIIATLP